MLFYDEIQLSKSYFILQLQLSVIISFNVKLHKSKKIYLQNGLYKKEQGFTLLLLAMI